MKDEIVGLTEDLSASPLYSADLAPVPGDKRIWTTWSLAALWVGMAVCIPTYLLASYMIKSGMGWIETLVIIGIANLIITIPLVLNGHAGVKYGIPFPVLGRASFGTKGIHVPSLARGIVACGWFGIQTWVGGLAIYEMIHAFSDNPVETGLTFSHFACFGVFWFINMYFIWKGNESIKWLEEFSAPILILLGVALIVWGTVQAGGFGLVLNHCEQLQKPSVTVSEKGSQLEIKVHSLVDANGKRKATDYQLALVHDKDTVLDKWSNIQAISSLDKRELENTKLLVRAKNDQHLSSWVSPTGEIANQKGNKIWEYIKWLTIMLGFWATMSISIADITRYAPSQRSQKAGQFIGLPGTMLLYSFVAIFVTCAAAINFKDVLLVDDAPWDPTALLGKFENPWVVIASQFFMLIATLSTNIAANVIAPSYAFSNLFPKKISFKQGGTITGIVGIVICPWWLMDDISNLMLFISGLLGPVLGIMLCDYFVLRKKELKLAALYQTDGVYAYQNGFNLNAMLALVAGIVGALIWSLIPSLSYLSTLAWFSGFFIAFVLYYILMMNSKQFKNSIR